MVDSIRPLDLDVPGHRCSSCSSGGEADGSRARSMCGILVRTIRLPAGKAPAHDVPRERGRFFIWRIRKSASARRAFIHPAFVKAELKSSAERKTSS